MNLVAKEFVACQINKPPGVLVVSPFAGAGETMQEALVCNPYEIEHAADVIHRYVSILSLGDYCICGMFCFKEYAIVLMQCITNSLGFVSF